MKSPEEIKLLFEEKYFAITKDTILEMNQRMPNGALNDVIVRLNRHCSGIFIDDESNDKIYNLFYISNENNLEGHLLRLTIDNPERNNLTFYFSDQLSYLYENIDTLDTFNVFQSHTRSYLESIGYFTINPEEFKKLDDPNPIIMAPYTRGIIKVPIFDKVNFYKIYFNCKNNCPLNTDVKYIYIMLNQRNNLYKIGSSKNPFHRESTLQSQEPEIELIALWSAPLKVETELHKQYKIKRKRGEWFKLSFNDLKQIKESMSIHE